MTTKAEAPAWLTKAVEIFDNDAFKDGDTLSHEWIKFALDIPVASSIAEAEQAQWVLLERVEKLKSWLLEERKIALQNVRGEGYRIVPPRDQARVAAEEAMHLVKKGLQRGEKLMHNTRLSELNSEEKKRHTDAHVRLSGIGGLVKKQRRDIFALLPKGV